MKTKPETETKPRTIDPGIAALRAEHQARVAAFKAAQASAATVNHIIKDLLPKLTPDDKTLLLHSIKPDAK